mmetsp:Transcript_24206/g.47580  ORF Transcript_24206/g.47580 Transcript_24206/m.47580 type:complete len:163 (+) Transcript_24206:2094-2582(+)
MGGNAPVAGRAEWNCPLTTTPPMPSSARPHIQDTARRHNSSWWDAATPISGPIVCNQRIAVQADAHSNRAMGCTCSAVTLILSWGCLPVEGKLTHICNRNSDELSDKFSWPPTVLKVELWMEVRSEPAMLAAAMCYCDGGVQKGLSNILLWGSGLLCLPSIK